MKTPDRANAARPCAHAASALAALLALGACALALAGARLPPARTAWTLDAPSALSHQAGTRAVPAASPFALTGGVDVNAADARALAAVEGVGEKLAAAIVAEREQHGPFAFPEDLLRVKGVGESTLAELAPLLRLD